MMGPSPERVANQTDKNRGGIVCYSHFELCEIAAHRELSVDVLMEEWKRFVRATNPAPETHEGREVEF